MNCQSDVVSLVHRVVFNLDANTFFLYTHFLTSLYLDTANTHEQTGYFFDNNKASNSLYCIGLTTSVSALIAKGSYQTSLL